MATHQPAASPSPITAPPHVLALLSRLHATSLAQEAQLAPKGSSGKVFSSTLKNDLSDQMTKPTTSPSSTDPAPAPDPDPDPDTAFDALMLDKFIALDESKCQFLYALTHATRALRVVEAGTSFGVSTIYLALAVSQVERFTGQAGKGTVIATEKEGRKAAVARGYWRECGEEVAGRIDLRVGDLREELKWGMPGEGVDLLLLDIWSALALPTLRIVQPHLRHGAVVLTDNTISGADGYRDLLAYLREPAHGFRNMTLPFENGFEMSVYLPGLV